MTSNPSTAFGGPPPRASSGRIPRWTIAFLRALERTGDVRASAEDAGIDHSTAYARRRGNAGFAADWEAALAAHAAGVTAQEVEELARLAPSPSHGCAAGPSLSLEGRGVNGARMKRAGHDRWSARKEKLFFDELAATANVKQAARAAGVSPNAVYQRRLRDAHFRAKWAAVLETGRAAIEMQLVERAKKSFDAHELDVGDGEPRVTVTEALRIVGGGGRAERAVAADPFGDGTAQGTEDIGEVRERLVKKLLRLKQRDTRQRLAEGWAFDEERGIVVPPGWVRGPA